MSVLETLYARHKSHLTQAQSGLVEEFIRRRRATEAFVNPTDMTPLEAQSGYLTFEREVSSEPVHLFGQDVASLAHTRVRVFRARADKEGGLRPAEEIFSARISEKALTESMLLSDRGEGKPITVTRLGDFDLPPRKRQVTRAERIAKGLRDTHEQGADDAMQELRTAVTGATRSTAELRSAAGTLQYRVRDMLGTDFALKNHLEEMSKLRSEVLTEAAHAALYSEKVARALAGAPPAIAPPAEPDWHDLAQDHPMIDHALDPLPDEYREALRVMICAEIRFMSERHPRLESWIKNEDGVEQIIFPSDRDAGVCFTNAGGADGTKDREWSQKLQRLWNWAFNPSIAAARPSYTPEQACMRVGTRSGWLGNIHSSLPPVEGSYFTITISPAYQEIELGATWMRANRSALVEIEIVAEDMMTALRGHPEGHPIPCSLRTICGIWRDEVERPRHALVASIAAISKDLKDTPEVAELLAALEAVTVLCASKRTGRAWKGELEAAVDRLDGALKAASQRIEQELQSGRDMVDEHVVDSARDILHSIARTLPDEAINLLRIGKK